MICMSSTRLLYLVSSGTLGSTHCRSRDSLGAPEYMRTDQVLPIPNPELYQTTHRLWY